MHFLLQDQYVFVYDCLLEALISGDTLMMADEYPDMLSEMCQYDNTIQKTKLEEQFDVSSHEVRHDKECLANPYTLQQSIIVHITFHLSHLNEINVSINIWFYKSTRSSFVLEFIRNTILAFTLRCFIIKQYSSYWNFSLLLSRICASLTYISRCLLMFLFQLSCLNNNLIYSIRTFFNSFA